MKIDHVGRILRISEIVELTAINASDFREKVMANMRADIEAVEIDLTVTRFVDSSGLGALFSLYKIASNKRDGIILRMINPRPAIQQLMELTQLHQLFEICHR